MTKQELIEMFQAIYGGAGTVTDVKTTMALNEDGEVCSVYEIDLIPKKPIEFIKLNFTRQDYNFEEVINGHNRTET